MLPQYKKVSIKMVLGVVIAVLLSLTACSSQQIAEYKEKISAIDMQVQNAKAIKDEAIASLEAEKARLDSLVQTADQMIADARAEADAMPPGPEKDETLATIAKLEDGSAKAKAEYAKFEAEISDKIEEADEFVDEMSTVSADYQARLEDVQTGYGATAAAVESASPYIPAPWNVLALGVTSVLWGLENRKKKKAQQAEAEAQDVKKYALDEQIKLEGMFSEVVEAIETAKREGQGKVDFQDKSTRDTIRSMTGADSRRFVDQVRKNMNTNNPYGS